MAFDAFFNAHYAEVPGGQLFRELLSAISKVVNLAENKDTRHSERVAVMSLRLARTAGITNYFDLGQIYFAGLLHDVGEIAIPDALLHRKGKLNTDEFQLLTTHTKIGRQIVEQIPFLEDASKIVFWHHERWDGTGYPEGLIADETPIASHVVSLCDALDNIKVQGLYSRPWEWREELYRYSGIQFNPYLVPPAIKLGEEGAFDDCQLSPEETEVLRFAEKDERVAKDLRENYITTMVNFFATLVEAKHRDSASHAKRVSRLARKIGQRMGLAEVMLDTVELAGYFHDIGKMGIPNSILEKPDTLDEEEFELIKRHPEYSAEILSPLSGFGEVTLAVRHHHEKWDGTGYPSGLRGEQIPILARIIFLADVVDFIAHFPRITKEREIRARQLVSDPYGGYFDPKLSRYFEEFNLEMVEREA